jgi:penicillin-binding protein 2
MAFFSHHQKRTSSRESGEIDDAVLTATQKGATYLEWPLNRRFFTLACAGSFFLLLLLVGRVFDLSVVQGEKYRSLAERNSIRLIPIPAPRGIIFDHFGVPLVQNAPSLDAVFLPKNMPKESFERERLLIALKDIFHLDENFIRAVFAQGDQQPDQALLLKEHVSQEESIRFLAHEREWGSVALRKTARRSYDDGLIFSHILGYEGKIQKEELTDGSSYLPTDIIGRQGIEKQYESLLRGERGFFRAEVDSLGRVQRELGTESPKPGADLTLHIDAGLQKKLFDSLQSELEKGGLKAGAAMAIDPRDGGVLALVSIPSYDNNLFAEGIQSEAYQELSSDSSKPLFDRVIAGAYPPGSTIKPVIASAALSEGVVTEHTSIESRGGISIGNFFFGDWKAHGFTDVRHAIAVSSDVYFYSVGGGYGGITGLGMNRMKKYEELFGYGVVSGIDLPGEQSGFLPDPEWKQEHLGERWFVGDDYHAAIGQGFVSATPLQILNAIATIGNGGTLYEPHIAESYRRPDGAMETIPPVAKRKDVVSQDILRIVREGMRLTVTEGTAQSLRDLPIAVAGKTGTAQFQNNVDRTHGWFVSFAPFDQPSIAMIVLVEGQGENGYHAVPVSKDVYQWYFTEGNGAKR